MARFRLRTLFVLMLLVGIAFGHRSRTLVTKARAESALRRLGARIVLVYEAENRARGTNGIAPPSPEWVYRYFTHAYDVEQVTLSRHESNVETDSLDESVLKCVGQLTSIRSLDLSGMRLPENSHEELKRLTELESLDLFGSQLSYLREIKSSLQGVRIEDYLAGPIKASSRPDAVPVVMQRAPPVGSDVAPKTALDGYCCVTVVIARTWVRGDRSFKLVRDGQEYLFAGRNELEMFEQDPERFAPVLKGLDIVEYETSGVLVPGRREYAVRYQGRTYLFASGEALNQFHKDLTPE